MRTLIVAVTLAAAPLFGSAEESGHERALAAGYKAAFTCSGVFNAGQTPDEIRADDLEGIYAEFQAMVRALPAAEVDRARHLVSVAFDEKLPPRLVAWRAGLGCTQLPIGAGPELAASLPQLEAVPPTGNPDVRDWPDGDAGAGAAAAPSGALARLAAAPFDSAAYGAAARTTAILIVKDGKILAERYRPGYDLHTPQRTWSAAKSITASLVGRAVELKLLTVEAPANIPEWHHPGDPRAAITLAMLMHMNSGLWTDGPGNRTDEVYFGGGTITQWAAAMPLEASPGTRYRYANNDTLLVARSVRATLGDGQAAIDFPFTQLFWRIGMFHTTPETDWQGNYVLSSQVWSTARDLARLALLYLNDGLWKGERLLPRGWSAFVASPLGAQPPEGPGYGAFFWLPSPKQALPQGTFLMNGNRGQYVVMVPSRQLIVVRRGFDPDNREAFDIARFTRDVLASLD